jgi:hypothetical protein
MTSSFLYRKLGQSYPAGTIEAAFGAADEERIYDMPNLHSWFTADPAYFNSGTGTYSDKGPRGNNWVQPVVGQQPTPVANWRSTGWPALSFDGITNRIPANFNAPVGPMTLAAVIDVLINDLDQAVIASNIGSAVSVQYFLAAYHAGIDSMCRFSGAFAGGTGTVGTQSLPMIIVGNFDPINGTIDVQKNGGTWTTITGVQANQNNDVTMQLGAYRTPTGLIFTGNIAEAFVFTSAMKGTADLTTLVAAMKAKYAIP